MPLTGSTTSRRGRGFEPDGVQRQEADAHAGHHRLLDGLVRSGFDHFRRPEPLRGKRAFHGVARSGPTLADEERLARELRKLQAALRCEGVVGRCHDGERMPGERDARQCRALAVRGP